MADSPTSRTLAECRSRGWPADRAEYWHAHARKRFDLFGFIDVVALTGRGILGIQATTQSNASKRVDKIAGLPAALDWLAAGGLIEVWGWSKRGPRGKRKLWSVRVYRLERAGGAVVAHDRGVQ